MCLIGEGANGTDSYEKNQNLVLTDETRADSIPNLEIKNGNIEEAGHASATGRFDDEQLFYLRSRGIPRDERAVASSSSDSSWRSCRRSASTRSRPASKR